MEEKLRKSHPVRPLRLDDINWIWLNQVKVGTWNQTFNILKLAWEKANGKNKRKNR